LTPGILELDREEIDAFLREQVVGRIGCHADGVTYVVPVIYAYDGEAVYAHTIVGQKVAMMRANPDVCFEVDEYDAGSWRSVIVQGRYEELEGAESERVLGLLSARFADRPRSGDRQRGDGRPGVSFRIAIAEVTGRAVRRGIA
jgi:nitroimidazol reductase NimA-like FMN-containing flavoprotein (pyridoxamine 5'-phosphate oxidase superfamily)